MNTMTNYTKNFEISEEIKTGLNFIDFLDEQRIKYKQAMSCSVYLKFKGLGVYVDFLDNNPLFLENPPFQSEFGEENYYDIGEVFTFFYSLYLQKVSNFDLSDYAEFYNYVGELNKLLESLIKIANNRDDSVKTLIHKLDALNSSEEKLLGEKLATCQLFNTLTTIVNENKKVVKGVFATNLQNFKPATYHCQFLYQVLFTILDYLFNYEEEYYSGKNRRNRTMHLCKCATCGCYFLAADKRKNYCRRKCQLISNRKRNKNKNLNKTKTTEFEKRIYGSLYQRFYRYMSFTRAENYKQDEADERENLLKTWQEQNKIMKTKPEAEYHEWLRACNKLRNEKTKERYKKFHDWLKQQEGVSE